MGHVFFRALQKLLVKLFNQYVATFFSFIYTVIWYGLKRNLTWSVLSYFEYKIEKVVEFVGNTDVYKNNIYGIVAKRLHAALSVPLALLSLFINMFLLNAAEMQEVLGNIFNGE